MAATVFYTAFSFITLHRHWFNKDGVELNKSFCICILSEVYSVDIHNTKKKCLAYYSALSCGAQRKLLKVYMEPSSLWEVDSLFLHSWFGGKIMNDVKVYYLTTKRSVFRSVYIAWTCHCYRVFNRKKRRQQARQQEDTVKWVKK